MSYKLIRRRSLFWVTVSQVSVHGSWPCPFASGGMVHHNGSHSREALYDMAFRMWKRQDLQGHILVNLTSFYWAPSPEASPTSHLYHGWGWSLYIVLWGTLEIQTLVPWHLQQPSSGFGVRAAESQQLTSVSQAVLWVVLYDCIYKGQCRLPDSVRGWNFRAGKEPAAVAFTTMLSLDSQASGSNWVLGRDWPMHLSYISIKCWAELKTQ